MTESETEPRFALFFGDMSDGPDTIRCTVLLPAGGSGSRFGGPLPKQFVEVAGRSLLAWTLSRFDAIEQVERIIIAVPSSARERAAAILEDGAWRKPIELVDGGASRQESVRNALAAAGPAALVAVHDAVRPIFSADLLRRLLTAAMEVGGAIPVRPVTETIHRVEDGFIAETPRREGWFAAQTPQCFRAGILRECLEKATADQFTGTDEAGLLVRYGHSVRVLEGEESNIKVTHASDVERVERALERQEEK